MHYINTLRAAAPSNHYSSELLEGALTKVSINVKQGRAVITDAIHGDAGPVVRGLGGPLSRGMSWPLLDDDATMASSDLSAEMAADVGAVARASSKPCACSSLAKFEHLMDASRTKSWPSLQWAAARTPLAAGAKVANCVTAVIQAASTTCS